MKSFISSYTFDMQSIIKGSQGRNSSLNNASWFALWLTCSPILNFLIILGTTCQKGWYWKKNLQLLIFQINTIPNNSLKNVCPIAVDNCRLHLLPRRLIFAIDWDHYRKPHTIKIQIQCSVLIDTSTKHSPIEDSGNTGEEAPQRFSSWRIRAFAMGLYLWVILKGRHVKSHQYGYPNVSWVRTSP